METRRTCGPGRSAVLGRTVVPGLSTGRAGRTALPGCPTGPLDRTPLPGCPISLPGRVTVLEWTGEKRPPWGPGWPAVPGRFAVLG